MKFLSLSLFVVVTLAHSAHRSHPKLSTGDLNATQRVAREMVFIELIYSNDLQLYGFLKIGDQEFKVQFSTMENFLWVPSSRTTSAVWSSKTRYQEPEFLVPFKYPDFKKPHSGGYLSGIAFCDTLKIGVHAWENFQFGAAKRFPNSWMLPVEVDGVFGLGRGAPHPPFTGTNLDLMSEQGTHNFKIFCLEVCPESEDESDDEDTDSDSDSDSYSAYGTLTFGAECKERYTHQGINYITLRGSEHWSFVVTGIRYKEITVTIEPSLVHMDTAGLYLELPKKYMKYINQRLDKVRVIGNFYYVDCAIRDELPTVRFLTATGELKIYPNQYILQNMQGRCYSAFVESDTWKFGVPAHRHYGVVYDSVSNKIGFADIVC